MQRFRVNGKVAAADVAESKFLVDVAEAYPNCPKVNGGTLSTYPVVEFSPLHSTFKGEH